MLGFDSAWWLQVPLVLVFYGRRNKTPGRRWRSVLTARGIPRMACLSGERTLPRTGLRPGTCGVLSNSCHLFPRDGVKRLRVEFLIAFTGDLRS
jgi:hypothetical protein